MKTDNDKNRVHNRITGYTLMELMITIGIVAILAAAAAPSLRDMISSVSVSSYGKDIGHILKAARLAAVNHEQTARVCSATLDSSSGNYNCDSDPDNWNANIIAFVDSDNDRVCTDCGDLEEDVTRVDNLVYLIPPPRRSTISFKSDFSSVVFAGDGTATFHNGANPLEGNSKKIVITDKDGYNNKKREIEIEATGRISYIDG